MSLRAQPRNPNKLLETPPRNWAGSIRPGRMLPGPIRVRNAVVPYPETVRQSRMGDLVMKARLLLIEDSKLLGRQARGF